MILTILIWFIAVSLACIAFALGGLWISETLTRLRRRLKPQTSRGVYLLIIPTALVSLTFSIIALRMLIQAHMQLNYDRGWLLTPPALISMSVIAFALILTVAGLIGDRSRGRSRCPKCWYDTSAGVDLRCPECGHEVRDQRGFYRSRRPRWVFVCATILCSSSVYILVQTKSINENGPFVLVPSWALMLGWDTFSESWITNRSPNPIEGCLEDRIRSGSIGPLRIARFMRRLSAPLDDDPDLCFDFKRMSLLWMCSIELESVANESESEIQPIPGINLDSILASYTAIYIDAITAQNSSAEQIELLQEIQNETSAFSLIHDWMSIEIARSLSHDKPGIDKYEPEVRRAVHERITRATSAIRHRMKDPAFLAAIHDSSGYVSSSAVMLLTQCGMLPELIEYCMSIPETGPFIQENWYNELYQIRFSMQSLDDQELEQVMSVFDEKIRHGNIREQSFALLLLLIHHYSGEDTDRHKNSAWLTAQRESLYLVTHELRYGMGRWRSKTPIASAGINVLGYVYEDTDRYFTAARAVMNKIDPTTWPSITAPHARDWSIQPTPATPEYIRIWIDHFHDLSGSGDAAQVWMAQNAPYVMPGDDERLDQLIWALIADPNDDVSYEAVGRYSHYLDDWIKRNTHLIEGGPEQRTLAIEQFPEMPPAAHPEIREIGLRLIMDDDSDVAQAARVKLHRIVKHFGME